MINEKFMTTIMELIEREIGHLQKQLGDIKDVAVQIAINSRIKHLEETKEELKVY